MLVVRRCLRQSDYTSNRQSYYINSFKTLSPKPSHLRPSATAARFPPPLAARLQPPATAYRLPPPPPHAACLPPLLAPLSHSLRRTPPSTIPTSLPLPPDLIGALPLLSAARLPRISSVSTRPAIPTSPVRKRSTSAVGCLSIPAVSRCSPSDESAPRLLDPRPGRCAAEEELVAGWSARNQLPHPARWNWYQFQVKDKIGSFFYFPSLSLQRAAGGYSGITINNRDVIAVSFGNTCCTFNHKKNIIIDKAKHIGFGSTMLECLLL